MKVKTTRKWAWKQPSYNESVIAHWSQLFEIENEGALVIYRNCVYEFLIREVAERVVSLKVICKNYCRYQY